MRIPTAAPSTSRDDTRPPSIFFTVIDTRPSPRPAEIEYARRSALAVDLHQHREELSRHERELRPATSRTTSVTASSVSRTTSTTSTVRARLAESTATTAYTGDFPRLITGARTPAPQPIDHHPRISPQAAKHAPSSPIHPRASSVT